MQFRLVTLGELSLIDETGQRLTVPRKALALLAVLASAGAKGVSRDRIMALLWPDAEDSGRGALKQTIYELRQTLRNPTIVNGTAELSVDTAQLCSDINDLERAYAARQWDLVVERYAGPFLDQFYVRASAEFEHWLDASRTHYDELFRRALERYAVDAAERRDWSAAVSLWRRLAAVDPLSARVALGLMKTLDAAGNAAGALTHYRVHRQLLHDQLGTLPDATVASEAERIRARHSGPTADPGVAASVTSGETFDADVAQADAPIPTLPVPLRRSPRALASRNAWVTAALFLVTAGTVAVAMRERSHARVLTSIPLPPNASSRVAVDVGLNRIYVDGGASFDHAITVIEGDTYQLKRLPHGAGVGIDAITHWYWTGDYGGRFVVVRNGRTDSAIARVPVPGCPHTLTIGAGRTWVAQQCDDHISVIDNRTRAVIRHIPVATLSRAEVNGAKGMGEILVNRNTGVVFFGKDMIPHRLDPRTWDVREMSDFGGPVIGINDAANRVYVRLPNGLQIIDGATEKPVAHVQLASPPHRLAVGFGGNQVYVATAGGLYVVDGWANRVVSTVSFGDGFAPHDVAVDDTRNRAFVLGHQADGTPVLKVVALRD